jgi:uncharacterized membrane protein
MTETDQNPAGPNPAEAGNAAAAPAQQKHYEIMPFVAPCRDLSPKAPFQWLALGWKDFLATPALSLTWGLASVIVFALVAWAAWVLGRWVLLIGVLSGFVFIAPLMAFALYSVSRHLMYDIKPTLRSTLRAIRAPLSNSMVFALVLLVIFLLWARAGSMVHIFFPAEGRPGLTDLLTFFLIGSAVGSVFALVTFATSAFSLPFIANREVDVVTAVVSSINAVMRNKWTMLTWAFIIALLTLVGLATGLLGFIVIIPWLAYATWHGYRAALDASGWETLPKHIN